MPDKIFNVDVCMVVHNDLTRDSRVRKEAASLVSHGRSVLVVGITRRGYNLPQVETVDGFTILRVTAPNWYITLSKSVESLLYSSVGQSPEAKSLQKKEYGIDTTHKGDNLLESNKQTKNLSFINKVIRKIKNIPYRIINKFYSSFLSLTSYSAIYITLLSAIGTLQKIKAKVYHAHDFPGLLQLSISGIWKVPIVYDSHELFFDQWSPNKPPIIYQWLEPLEKRLAQKAAKVITVSEGIADKLEQVLQIPRPLVVRNAVPLQEFSEPAVDYPTIELGYKTVVHSGMITVARHLPELVKSLAYLPKNIAIVLMGEGSLTEELIFLSQEINASDRLKIMPAVDTSDVARTLAQADVGVVLITNQNVHYDFSLPNKFFECIAAGLPLVVSPCQEIAELTKRYEMGEICDPNDPESIAKAILRVLETHNLSYYKENVNIARKSYLNWQIEEEKLIRLYSSLIA